MKGTKKFNRLLSLLLALALVWSLAGCGGSSANQEPAPGTAPAEGAVDPDAEIVLAGYRNLAPGEKDGYYCSKILYVWEPLVTQDDTAAPVPAWRRTGR